MAVAQRDLLGDLVEADAAEAADGAGEVLVDQLLAEADGLEDLGAGVGRDRGDAHLGHHLEDALAGRLDVVLDRLAGSLTPSMRPSAIRSSMVSKARYGLMARGAVAEQQAHVVHLAGLAGLDHEADPGAGLLADEVVVHGRGEQQRRDRRQLVGGAAVGQDDDVGAVGDGLAAASAAHRLERLAQALAALGHRVEAADDDGLEVRRAAVVVDVDELGQLVVVEDRARQVDLAARPRGRARAGCPRARWCVPMAVTSSSRMASSGGLVTWANSWREVVEQQPGAVGQHGDRRVGAHRAEGLGAGAGHGREEDLELLGGVAEHLLALHHACRAGSM